MMEIVITDTAAMGEDLDFSVLEEFGEVAAYTATDEESLPERIADADIVLTNKVRLDGRALACGKKLRLVCVFATGYDNIDVEYCRSHGIALCNVRGYSTQSVVQLTVATVLSLIQRLPLFAEHVRSGAYSAGGAANYLKPVFCEVAGKTWGVVGAGEIGRGVARVAEALGCRVLTYRRHPESGDGSVDLTTLCRESDIITLHTPLNDSTRGMFSAERIAQCRRGFVLVNTARGAVTDEAAVADAVRSGQIGFFGTDVYSDEPFGEDHPFYSLRERENVCFTPHIAWAAKEARERCLALTAENIHSFLSGGMQNRIV